MDLRVHLSRAAGLAAAGIPRADSFRRWVEAALAAARRRRASEVSIHLVGDDEGRRYNRDYRGRDYATNVLSFPAELPAGVRTPLLGDLIVCAPVVAREAAEQHKPPRHHYAHMTVHGVLHLLGYDHHLDIEAEQMEAIERRALARLGIADPYV
ncbi:MAG: rRNA maturation RNase YbeY [Rhodanobacteraceae bacterium]|nr:rRNA maturation RNase YbeY [Rhodanobacteraceae bacterium]